MIGRRPEQQSPFPADNQYLDFVGTDSFYGFLARHGRELFGDEDFAGLYCEDFGRPSVPPSLLAIALLLQTHDKVSDAEATRRATFDMCWKVVLGVEMDERPFAKSTLRLFRAQLVIHTMPATWASMGILRCRRLILTSWPKAVSTSLPLSARVRSALPATTAE